MHNPLNRIPLEPVPSGKTLTCWRGHSAYFRCGDCQIVIKPYIRNGGA
jgi:hypothetical protein